jgi:hypothetical protein
MIIKRNGKSAVTIRVHYAGAADLAKLMIRWPGQASSSVAVSPEELIALQQEVAEVLRNISGSVRGEK